MKCSIFFIFAFFMLTVFAAVYEDNEDTEDFTDEDEDGDGYTPLMNAVANNDIQNVRQLLEQGEPINDTNPSGETALTLASFYGYLDIVQLLCESGADINMGDEDEGSALNYALNEKHFEIARYLLDRGANLDSDHDDLYNAIVEGDNDLFELLLRKGANIHMEGGDDDTDVPLIYAVRFNRLEMVVRLLVFYCDSSLSKLWEQIENEINENNTKNLKISVFILQISVSLNVSN